MTPLAALICFRRLTADRHRASREIARGELSRFERSRTRHRDDRRDNQQQVIGILSASSAGKKKRFQVPLLYIYRKRQMEKWNAAHWEAAGCARAASRVENLARTHANSRFLEFLLQFLLQSLSTSWSAARRWRKMYLPRLYILERASFLLVSVFDGSARATGTRIVYV